MAKSRTVKQVFDACPNHKKLIISDFYCVPMGWKSPTTGRVSGPFFVAKLSSNLFAELHMSGRLESTIPAKSTGYLEMNELETYDALENLHKNLVRLG